MTKLKRVRIPKQERHRCELCGGIFALMSLQPNGVTRWQTCPHKHVFWIDEK